MSEIKVPEQPIVHKQIPPSPVSNGAAVPASPSQNREFAVPSVIKLKRENKQKDKRE